MPFKPGQSGNPSGRPKQDPEFKELCTNLTFMGLAQLAKILKDGNHRHFMNALKFTAGYAHGMPVAKQEVQIDNVKELFEAAGETVRKKVMGE